MSRECSNLEPAFKSRSATSQRLPNPANPLDVTNQTPSRALGVQSILNPPESRDGETAAYTSHVQQPPHQRRPQCAASIGEAQSNTRSAGPRQTLTHISSPPLPARGVDSSQLQTRRASSSHAPHSTVQALAVSQSESPSISHSSYSNVSQTSPIFNSGNSFAPPPIYQPAYAAPPVGFQYPTANAGYGESQYLAVSDSYQMTLDTKQGPMIVPVKVDLQQASKIADEKRKRNAGASARFRARRKKKEKEALHSISAMEKEVRDIAEERDFYISERNYFRDLAMRHLGLGQIPPRPPSPPVRKPLLAPAGSDSSGAQVQDPYRELANESPRPAVRRRTGDYRPPLSSSAASVSPMLPQRMQFPVQYPTQTPPLPPLPPMHTPYPEQRALPLGPPPQRPPPPPPAATRSRSYDPFRPDIFNRSWDPGS
jgi:hypothetical protein